jgi:hypothetical protein
MRISGNYLGKYGNWLLVQGTVRPDAVTVDSPFLEALGILQVYLVI